LQDLPRQDHIYIIPIPRKRSGWGVSLKCMQIPGKMLRL
jgi:hypothetical protein